ncbi:hypothetical protein AUEXF2481DRAFT_41293 [Aureobasidium subglaciale EXF-2481]|uniref:RNA recognition motif-containing protein n=1 Tax=Aureobasidium subglaciale (strain EXF-2481) TaxID=1043005 RepID=A0A074YJ70_AURSE|nr:uncharacterized protein AUEXF2481DRAFT_41293 [Aureobasidium subglaciale EXF-2481]KEQ94102.1 hypothetical protein AUEXF2481DRAFT_41293 [Aureobasidium subglaciale EXF-2481]
MPALPGEALLLNIFVDVHAYFNQPASKPVHHRFDKGSYLYLYYNSTQRRARLEVANSAGTPDQDAFNGYLDHAMFANSYKHPNLFTIGVESLRHGGASPRPADHSHWHLPAFGLTHEHKYLYKIHTLDLYLWTTNDAIKFLDLMKRILPQQNLDIHEAAPLPEHDGSMSPVVQQLESMAIHTPPHACAASTVSNASHQSRQGHTPEGQRTVFLQTALASPPMSASQLAPYNPAAPSAPEPIAHREKTPPPPDAGSGTGLTATAIHDHPGAYTTAGAQYNNVPPQRGFPGPPQRATSLGSFPPPPPLATHSTHPSLQTAHSFAGPPTSSQSSTPQQQHHAQTQYASYPQHQSAQYPQSPGFSMHTPLQSPGVPGTPSQPPAYGIHTPLQSPAFAPQHFPQSPGLGSTPHGGFSNYTYGAQSSRLTLPTEAFAVHSQAYRPTEQEVSAHGHGHGSKVQQQVPFKPGGFEERLKKTEKGVGRFLRKLDQKM